MKSVFPLLLLFLLAVSCKKKKIESNLENSWTINSLTDTGDELIDSNTFMSITFLEPTKGEGDLSFTVNDEGVTSNYTGVYSIDKDYNELALAIATDDPASTWLWNVDFTVSETNLELNGYYRYTDDLSSFFLNGLTVSATK